METFVAPSGQPVFKVVTPSGITGFATASVAELVPAALIAWQRQLLLKLLANIWERRAMDLAASYCDLL
jgi:hypothetical protein